MSELVDKIKSGIATFELPDFDIIQIISTYTHIHEVGDQKIVTFFFDINQTPNLKIMFDEHLKVLLE